MKISSLFTSAALTLALSTGFCSENPLSGIYIFADVGGEHSTTKNQRKQSNLQPIAFFVSQTKSFNNNHWFGGGGVGVSGIFNDAIYLAAEFNGNAFNNSGNNYLAKNSLDVLIKPGYVFPTNTAVYAQTGFGMSKINHNSFTYQCGVNESCGPNTFVYTGGVNKYMAQFLLGGGVRQALTDSLSISVEAQYVKQSQFKVAGATYSPTVQIYNVHENSVQTHSAQGLIKLNYIIGNS